LFNFLTGTKLAYSGGVRRIRTALTRNPSLNRLCDTGGVMGMKKLKDDRQLSLFDQQATDVPNFNHFKESFVIDPEKVTSPKPLTSVVDFVRARFDANPNMDPEEYKRWIKILISSSLKRME
jgi:hypothetical protein